MLTKLEMRNIRKHAHTELFFDEDDQLLLLDGANEAGKTTILEAILWALYGETRHGHKRGRKGMAGLVRRNNEHEGAQVDLHMRINGTSYHIMRRWEKGKTTAVLYAGTTPLMRGVDDVTAAVTSLLGVDAAGFKLSAVAKQTERDELVDLDPAKRRAAVSRLLKHDTIRDAAAASRETYRLQKERANALHAAVEPDSHFTDRISIAEHEYDTSRTALTDTTERIADLTRQIADLSAATAAHSSELAARQAAESVAAEKQAAAARAGQRAEQAHAAVIDPGQPPEGGDTVDELIDSLADQIAVAKASLEQQAARHTITDALNRARTNLHQVQSELGDDTTETVQAVYASACDAVAAARAQEEQAAAGNAAAAGALAAAATTLQAASSTQAAIAELTDACPTCQQTISDSTHQQLLTAASEAVDRARAMHEHARDAARCAAEHARDAHTATVDATMNHQHAQQRLAAVKVLYENRAQLERAIASHCDTLARLHGQDTVSTADIEALTAARAHAEALRARRDAHTLAVAAYQHTLSQAHTARREAAEAHTQAQQALSALPEVDPVNADAAARSMRLAGQLEQENELRSHVAAQVAAAATTLSSLREAREKNNQLSIQLTDASHRAQIASKAAGLLAAYGKDKAAAAGPQLQEHLSDLLNVLSDGRFTAAQVDPDYTITVRDSDGSWQPVTEFSGGAIALIGLAIRLALARMIAGNGGVHGFLILDEVLGNQDPGRQNSILAGLRAKRGDYGQILLISHVDGVRNEVDRVISVEPGEDGTASVSG